MNNIMKSNTWIASSFDDFAEQPITKSQSFASSQSQTQSVSCYKGKTKRTISDTSLLSNKSSFPNKNTKLNCDELWADRYKPRSETELAVHKKKIAELRDFLVNSLALVKKHRHAPILVLTGPAGCGKSATLNVLATELGVEVQEWINPTTETNDNNWQSDWKPGKSDYASVGGKTYQSQVSLFQDFILRADRYPTLQIFNQAELNHKLILVEDFPNTFLRNTSVFHDILRTYYQRGRCPLIFIVSDSAGGDSNERHLFPKDLQVELTISNISFNPVALTSLTKVLTRIAASESSPQGSKVNVPSKCTIEGLAAACSGDIRAALNSLQFACLKDTHDLDDLLSNQLQKKKSTSRSNKSTSKLRDSTKKLSKKKSSESVTDLAAIGGKDTSLFLFHALGKILYCKRTEPPEQNDSITYLPKHLAHHYRDPLSFPPEDIVEKSQLSGEFFTSFLHENYLDFYTNLEDAVMATEYFSCADLLTRDWSNRTLMRKYAACVSSRGVMFCNSDRASHVRKTTSGMGWKPMHKPRIFETNRKIRSNIENARYLFKGNSWTPEEACLNYVPYAHLIHHVMKGVGQGSFINEMCRFDGKNIKRGNNDRLDEKDAAAIGDDEDDEVGARQTETIASQNEDNITSTLDDDELEIEDFDD